MIMITCKSNITSLHLEPLTSWLGYKLVRASELSNRKTEAEAEAAWAEMAEVVGKCNGITT